MKPQPAPTPDRFVWRFRLIASCFFLVAVSFSQRPGRIVGDTKLDLVVNPLGLLERSMHLWDPQGGFGQVQNQAYGYLFPIGPFHWLGDLLSVPGWAVQRLWWSVLLVTAFLGVVKLAAVLGLGSPTSRLIAGFAYALSPRILSLLGPISIEAWPSALAPWVLIPLVIGSRRGSPRAAALQSAAAVAFVGGVNAAATFAVIPLGAVWLLTRTPGPRRRALMTWWPVCVLAGTAWWLVPLLLLGRYSPPFLDYIETASVTTFPATLFDALRGTSHWVPYVDGAWQAGNTLITSGFIALDLGVLVVLGFIGIMLARQPHRQYLLIALLVGLLMTTAGHSGAMSGWFAGAERSALDGALAPLRNIHKFDPVIRLPLVLGLAHLLATMSRRAATERRAASSSSGGPTSQQIISGTVVVTTIVAILGIASPALASRLGTWNDFEAVPHYWARTADWLGAHTSDSTALLVPGSGFGQYQWGDPDDEPMQPLASSPWAVRNAVPLAPPGNIRMLDAIEEQLASGRPSDGLAGYLRRAGIGHLVVRNDLRAGDQPAPVLVHQALDHSPGLMKVKSFGPLVGPPARLAEAKRRTVIDDGWTRRYRAVEIYRVTGAHRAVVTSRTPVVIGGPEDLLPLTESGLLGDAPTVLASDAPAGVRPEQLLLTDGMRRRERNFARIEDGASATLSADDDGRRGAPARDYSLTGERWETTARILGARALSASSSRAFADTPAGVRLGDLPFAAFDGLLETAWRSGPAGHRRPWIKVNFEHPRTVASVDVVLDEDDDGERPTRVRAVTDAGSSQVVEARPGQPARITVAPGVTSGLKLISADKPGRELAVSEIRIPNLDVDRTLQPPRVPKAWGAPEAILLSATAGRRDECVRVGRDTRCAPDRGRSGEEPAGIDRTLRLGSGGTYRVAGWAETAPGQALDTLIQHNQFVNVSASSTAVADPRGSAVAAVDGDTGTTWIAAEEDQDPALTLRWLRRQRLTSVYVKLDRQAAASQPTRVELIYPGGSQEVVLDSAGRAKVRPFSTTEVKLRFTRFRTTDNFFSAGGERQVGVGVSELRLGGAELLPMKLSDQPVDVGCQFGPVLRVDGAFFRTSVTASTRQLYQGGMLPLRVCGPESVRLPSDSTRVVLTAAPAFRPDRLVLTRGRTPSPLVRPATVSHDSPVEREVTVPPGITSGTVAIRENQNPGWKATAHPSSGGVTSVTLDGWQQGWRFPEGVNRLDLSYGPDVVYRAALFAGGFLLLILFVATVALRRRRSNLPALAGRRIPAGRIVAGGMLALGVIGGWAAFGIGAAAVAVGVIAGRRSTLWVVSWFSGLPLAAAALFYWRRPWGSDDGWAGAAETPQLLVVVSIGLLLAGELLRVRRGRVFSRSAGSSRKR